MQAVFSRRAAKAMNSDLFFALSVDERQQFVDACVKAGSFEKLPDVWKQKMLASER